MTKRHCPGLVVSVVVNWNQPQETIRCIKSLEASTYGSHRIVIVDNGSDDASLEQIRAAAPTVETRANEENLGFAAGANLGMKRALEIGATYIFLLNNDATVAPDSLDPLVAACQADPSIGIAAPTVYRSSTGAPFSVGGWPRRFLPLLVHHYYPSTSRGDLVGGPTELPYVWAQAMLIRREVIEEIGFFDTGFFMYYEDCDLCLRASDSGFRIVHVPQSLVWHKVAQSTSQAEWTRWRHKIISMFRFYKKYGRWSVPQAVIQTLLTLGAIGLREVVQGNWRWVRYPLAQLMQISRGHRLDVL